MGKREIPPKEEKSLTKNRKLELTEYLLEMLFKQEENEWSKIEVSIPPALKPPLAGMGN